MSTEITLPDKFTGLELLAVDINANAAVQPMRIIVAYRPPDSTNDTNQLLISALDRLANDSVRVCIVGDLNLADRSVCVKFASDVYAAMRRKSSFLKNSVKVRNPKFLLNMFIFR